eukprot:gnl/Chilomastix_caulleri/4324.p1 GENE.gnl/Chilomastix_caulleri/4324~~gnl/Chilomastix_caulleri/4324.p1  ORF type:complete len:80 (+),score=23.22 gnl/Chilomastix_caulleri/4324:13-252(+)
MGLFLGITRLSYNEAKNVLVCKAFYDHVGMSGNDGDKSNSLCVKGTINAVDDALTKVPRHIIMWGGFLLTSFVFALLLK